MKKILFFQLFVFLAITGLLAGNSFAREVSVLGPKQYLRTSGSPNHYNDNFLASVGQGKIVVKNGSWYGTKRIIDSVSSASVYVNEVEIFGPKDFNKNIYLLEQNIPLGIENTISVEIASSPGSYITVEILKDITDIDVSLNVNPSSIFNGQSSVLTWSSSNADTCTIEPSIGSVDLNGSITVSPTETTTYTITASGSGGVVTSTATITLQNSAPTAIDQSLITNEDVAIPVTLTGSDPDNDALSYEIVANTTAGTLSGATPNLIYTPNNNYNGGDSFTFKTNDGQAESAPATITLTIQAVNDTPVANAGVDQGISRTDTAVLDGSGSIDIDGDTLTYQWSFASLPSGSSAVLSNPAIVNPVFVADVSGTYELELIVNDGTIASATDTVTITASPRMVAVPSLINLSQPDAEAAITSAGLVVGTNTTANSNTIPLNAVISQSPVSGTQIVEGSAIDLIISLGAVPSVNISANPESVPAGDSTILTWSSSDADTCTIEPGIGSVDPNGSITVSPAETIVYTITASGPGGVNSSTITVTVIPLPAVTITSNPVTIFNGQSSVLTWSSSNADTCTIEPGIGSVDLNSSITVSPSATTTYTITASGSGGVVTADTTITLQNSAPTAIDQSLITNEDVTIPVILTGSDPDNDVLSYEIITGPTAGTLSGTTPNLTYTPNDNYNGGDSFTFKTNDGQTDSARATISLTVQAVNDAPTANAGSDQEVSRTETVVLNGNGSGDIDGDSLTYQWTLVSVPSGSTTTLSNSSNENSSFIADVSGVYELELVVNDGTESSLPDTVIITVIPQMIAVPSLINLPQPDAEAAITSAGLVLGAITTTNSDTVPLNSVISQSPGSGTAVVEGSGVDLVVSLGPVPIVNISANPESITVGGSSTLLWSSTNAESCVIEPGIGAVDPNGSVTVSPAETTIYTITATGPGGVITANATVTLQNSLPTAADQSIITDEDTPISLTLTGSDPDNDTIVYEIIAGPSFGALSGTLPNLTYTPGSNYNGVDSFTFKTNDGQIDSAPATITLTVNPVNDVPIANAGSDQAILRTETVTLNGSGSSDIDGDTLTYQWSFASLPAGSSAVLSDSSNVSPTFMADISGVYELELVVNDGSIASSPTVVTITVSPQTVTVPSVVNLVQADAEAAISAVGLVTGTITTANSDTVPANSVISQSPVSGSQIVEGSMVDLVVSVGAVPNNLDVTIYAESESVLVGESTTLIWNSSRADIAFIEPGIGSVSANGTVIIAPDHTTTYTITATGSDGSISSQITVTVIGTPTPLLEGSFGGQYNNIVPSDATIESYDSERFSVITGEVYDLSGNPISDVCVSVFNRPEYGTAVTDLEGRFSIPVDGGGTLNLLYQKEEYLAVHRQVDVPWNDIALAETIVMTVQDSAATTLTFDGNSNTVITHQSTPVTDESGSRSVTMVFTGDNHAYLVDEFGNDVHELTSITTRATEFVIPTSMPAKLPPNSAFTYCSELSVDGVQRVRFEKPVIIWVNNFLGFEIGEIVPVGYYDRDIGVWVPSDNGVVVKLLDTDTDGVVDALDADGDNLPDDLNTNGSFSDEVVGLGDSSKYQPDATFWRVSVAHFTPYDMNWGPQPLSGARPPMPEARPVVDQQAQEPRVCNLKTGSHVNERSRIFHEDIAIPGTNIDLHYASNRVEGYKTIIRVPASGSSIPPEAKRLVVQLEVAGQRFEQVLDTLPDQTAEFIWDGLDFAGQPAGQVTAHAKVGFEYDLYYANGNPSFVRAFAQPGDTVTNVLERESRILWRDIDISVNNVMNANSIAEGWTLSVHHSSNPWDPLTLHKGNGNVLKNSLVVIDTVAGNGNWNHSGDGGNALDAGLYDPSNVVPDSTGGYYITEYWDHFIRYVDSDGNISTIAGTGVSGYNGDGIPAIDAQISGPWDAAVDDAGNLYIADVFNHRIRKIGSDGIISTIAGNGNPEYTGDGGQAKDAQIAFPFGIDTDSQGNIYFVDRGNYVIRKIDSGGIITTVAGNGVNSDGGDGGSAIQTPIGDPLDIVVDDSGNIYFSNDVLCKVRKVDSSGIITTIAGSSDDWEYSGDGGPATSADLAGPSGLAVDKLGNLYIADTYNYRIRKVDPKGIITTIAGFGEYGFSGDGDIPTRAAMSDVYGIAVGPDGHLYIADSYYDRIRKIDSAKVHTGLVAPNEIVFPESNGLGHIMSNTGLHRKTIDLDTGLVLREFLYSSDNQLISIIDQFDNQILINRDGNGDPVSITSPDGYTTQFIIGEDNHLDYMVYPDNSNYHFMYSSDGLLESKTEPNGNRFEHVFDNSGRLTGATDDEGGHWRFNRTVLENGDILSEVLTGEGDLSSYQDNIDLTGVYTSIITDPTGSQSFFTESNDGLLVDKSLSCGMNLEIKYEFDSEYRFKVVKEITETTPDGLNKVTIKEKDYQDANLDDIPDLITETISVNGRMTTFQNDISQSQKTITSPEGKIVLIQYDPNTLATNLISTPNLFDTSYGYDDQGRLTSVDINSRRLDYTYNDEGLLDTFTDAENHTSRYFYDQMGRVTQVVRPDTTSLWFDYDANGNMTILTNPSSVNHGFGFNNVNMKSSYSTPLSGSYNYFYDKDRRPIIKAFPSGESINFLYENGRLNQVQTSEGNIDYTYYCASKIESITKDTESIFYVYDGKLTTSEIYSGIVSQILGYAYNDDFNLDEFSYAGSTENYSYDNDELLIGAGIFTISRNPGNGLPESVTGGSLNLARSFNGYGEIDVQSYSIGGQNLNTWDLGQDNNGRITTKSETIDGVTSNYVYTFDSMGRLLTVTKDNVLVEEYRYDPNGTRNYEMNSLRGISGRNFIYSDEDHLLTAGTTQYDYDLDGFLTTRTQGSDLSTYDYSSRGELLSVALPDGKQIEYIHDPLGRRIAKKVNGSIIEKYLWKGLTTLLAVYDGSDNLSMRFEYADSRMPVAVVKNGVKYYLTYDQVGTLKLVADSSGNVVKKIEYDSFGNIVNDSAPAFEIPFGFAGGLYDIDTGLVRFGYRDYDPEIGRWTAKDPIGFAGGDTDLYGYVLNDPVNFVDPLGLESYHVPGTPYNVGTKNKDSLINEGDDISKFLSENVRHVDQLADIHDPLMDTIEDLGLPFGLFNIPTMIPSYGAACIYNSLTDYDNKSDTIIFIEIRW